jgi:hydroxymethylpyrimidine pyrophosphatase-like HAD family hydrolase
VIDVRALLSQFPSSHFALTQALTFCLELIPSSSNKGTALLHTIQHLNLTRPASARPIDLSGVLAFGDGGNDVPMFELAGMSVAMGNAMESARSQARWTTDTNDAGGVGTFLQKVFFPGEASIG